MKTILALTVLVAGICASIVPGPSFEPDAMASRDSRSGPISSQVETRVIEVIEEISENIRDSGLDPLYIPKENYAYALPVPVIFNAAAFLENILGYGLSDIVINDMNYSVILSRLDFALELPLIHFSARAATGEVTLFGEKLSAAADGRLDIQRITVRGRVYVRVGVISGVSIRSVTVDLNLGRIISNIRLAIQGNNYSQEINKFLSQTIPATLEEFKDEVDELIAILLLDIINENL
ncbi:hypothetical protein PYW08_014307 [Mythimna loreyi]|uniref:Uncharacterized protein n=1 Tax=Mythimna loreyi TaxID=667449 RepID=A0ACC2R766_9NEOP|nr:hypothetical protein PYW08_014307 [Mythimna loreyi]